MVWWPDMSHGELKKNTNIIIRLLALFRLFQIKIFFHSKNKFALERMGKGGFFAYNIGQFYPTQKKTQIKKFVIEWYQIFI